MQENARAATTTVVEDKTDESTQLSAEEERILRMRTGSSIKPAQKLESKLDDLHPDHRSEVAFRLALMEAEVLAKLKANPELRTDRKGRIVDALRKSDADNANESS